jgi:hypothetical protein
VDAGVSGGASYDASIAMIARDHGCELATLDARARATYDRIGVAVRYLCQAYRGIVRSSTPPQRRPSG